MVLTAKPPIPIWCPILERQGKCLSKPIKKEERMALKKNQQAKKPATKNSLWNATTITEGSTEFSFGGEYPWLI